ncbi:NAD-dependent succinate-semialdehyde dehydrogenase [Nocardioides sp. LS1]|uniref:NAD-dependent succinate-semialdehyde dehydrogenase n=1 Tax=Nocardioides sp. LS1 TaxID=1027620 RepID=UPI000F61D4A4|nr:NAD-dependent succinate-semialdehyde dehydrogenase [Nocardioides sp. LS1]GCD88127.1 aldehyde dehydrogenase family protein [Nocardioides sp. LS1]
MSTYAVTDPYTGKTIKEFDALTAEQLEAKVARADATYRSWGRTTSPAERSALLGRVAELYAERRDELARLISREMGKPVEQAALEVDFTGAIYDYYARNAETFLADEPVALEWGTGTAVVRRSPVGVLLGVMPWNYPYYQVARFAAPNLMAGNTILLKHAAQCPESAAAMEQIFLDAGLPSGAYENLYATYAQVDGLIADTRVQGVSVTGSEAVGAHVAELAGRNLKKVVLELGGNDPFMVLSTDDLDATVEAALGVRFYDNAGQMCCGAKRFIVIDDLYDAFVEKMSGAAAALVPGDPAEPGTALGPLSSVGAAEFLEDQVDRLVASGAKVVVGGTRDGAAYAPTVLVDIDATTEAAREELFGPVASVYRVGSEEEAIAVANDSPFGLGSYVFTNDTDQADRVANALDAGMVFVNIVGAEEPGLPFGGTKRSGFGRELGRFAVDEFVNRKLIRVAG